MKANEQETEETEKDSVLRLWKVHSAALQIAVDGLGNIALQYDKYCHPPWGRVGLRAKVVEVFKDIDRKLGER